MWRFQRQELVWHLLEYKYIIICAKNYILVYQNFRNHQQSEVQKEFMEHASKMQSMLDQDVAIVVTSLVLYVVMMVNGLMKCPWISVSVVPDFSPFIGTNSKLKRAVRDALETLTSLRLLMTAVSNVRSIRNLKVVPNTVNVKKASDQSL